MAKHNPYTLIASQRANYFLKGSPVQFVKVELLREEASGDVLVTLSFKNLFQRILTHCKINFVCKNALGQVIAQENFIYDGISVPEDETFGADEAVFVSSEQVASVENTLLEISFENGRKHDVSAYEIVRLPELRALSETMAGVMGATLSSNEVRFRPVQLNDGWQCTCGAFNYSAAKGTPICNECGQDKVMLFSALHSAEAPSGEGTRVFSAEQGRPSARANSETKAFYSSQPASKKQRKYSIMGDSTADFINKFVPLIALGASAIFIVGAVVLKQIIF